MSTILNKLQSYTDCLVNKYGVPALSIAVWQQNTLHQAAAGTLNLNTDVKATTDSIFHIGSITKVFTACLIMQLVEEGRIALDSPVKQYLRDFHVADREATESITVRQLLNHTNGIVGDYFPDDLRASGNPIARYVDRINLIPQTHAPGEGFSYSNAAYAVAGRLLEVVLGMSWFEAVAERIYQPLGMVNAVAHPMESLRYRAAMGHVPQVEHPKQWQLSPSCYLSMGLSPAGRLSMSMADLVTFARAHLNDVDHTRTGQPWLAPETVSAMQQAQVALPPYASSYVTHWGLGWSLTRSAGTPIVGHDGLTAGQSAALRLLPEKGLVIAAATNCSDGSVLKQVVKDLLQDLADVELIDPEPSDTVDKPERFVGTFESFEHRYQLEWHNEQLTVSLHNKIAGTAPQPFYLKPIGDDSFACYWPDGRYTGSNMTFLESDHQGIPAALFMGYRRVNRV